MKKFVGILFFMLLICASFAVSGINLEKTIGSEPDLSCNGEIIHNRLKPGVFISGHIIVKNIVVA